jgi:thiamine biosynthesis lipoprotein
VRFHRPLWLDLGGIAKGYAVDRAIDRLRAHGVPQGCVNAGGDLRCFGAEPERIQLRCALFTDEVPVIELSEGSLASSSSADREGATGWHIDGRTRRSLNVPRFTCVLAEQCLYADALTKITLAEFEDAAALLALYAATAHHYDAEHGWRTLGG